MFKKWIFVVLAVVIVMGCVNRDNIYANPPRELVENVEALLPAAVAFVRENEAVAREKGIALDASESMIAAKVGLKQPNRVRVYYVDQLPFPKDPDLALLARKYGYSSPKMKAYTYGYGIWIKHSAKGNRELLAHELIHVRQAEQMGLREQVKQYLMQLFIYGYKQAPMELEAYGEAGQYI